MSEQIRRLLREHLDKNTPRYMTDIDMPGIDMTPHQKELYQLQKDMHQELRRRRRPADNNQRDDMRLETPDDWMKAYQKGRAI